MIKHSNSSDSNKLFSAYFHDNTFSFQDKLKIAYTITCIYNLAYQNSLKK